MERFVKVIVLVVGFYFVESTWAANWINPAGGLFSTPGNWNGGVPSSGQAAVFDLPNTYAVNVNNGTFHGPLLASATGTANLTLDITGSGYSTSTTTIGGPGGSINSVTITGNLYNTAQVHIAPNAGQASLTLNSTVHAPYIAVGGTIVPSMVDPILDAQVAGGRGTLALNSGSDLTVQSLLADNAGADSTIVFNGGKLTIQGLGRFNTGNTRTFARIGNGTNSAVLDLKQGPVEFRPGIFEFGTETLNISTNATVNYDAYNANLRVGDIHRDTSGGPAGIFNWQNGLITLRTGNLDISESGQFGPNLVLSGNRAIELYQGTTTIASGGSLTLDGTSFSTNSLTNNGGTFTYRRGHLYMGNGGLEVGPGGITNPGGISIVGDIGSDVFNVSGGTLTIAAGRTVTIDGGTVYLGGIAGPGNLAFNRGYLELKSGDLSFGGENTALVTGSTLFLEGGALIVGTGKTMSFEGGSVTAKSIGGGGQITFNSGNLVITDGDLTLGATGHVNNNSGMLVEGGSSIRADKGTVTVQPGQLLEVDGGYISARTIVSNSAITVGGGGAIEGGSLYLGGIGGRGSLKAIVDGLIKLQRIGRNNLIVDGGTVQVSGEPAPPGEEDPVFDNSIVGGYDHDSQMTMNAGRVTTPNMKIGVTPGFTDIVTINGGRLRTDNLWAAGGVGSVFTFNGGTIETKHSVIDGPSTFVVGNGDTKAELILVDGTHGFADGLALSASGLVTGYGTIAGDVFNEGHFLPGDYDDYDGATIEVGGDFDNAGLLEFGVFDAELSTELVVNGSFKSGGIVAVTLFGYEPAVGDIFDLLDFANFVDKEFVFDFSNAPLHDAAYWDTSQFAMTGSIAVINTLMGDFDRDNDVDTADYIAWRKTDGSQAGYNLWRANFGNMAGGGSDMDGSYQNPVPEPHSLITTLLFVLLVKRRGRRAPACQSARLIPRGESQHKCFGQWIRAT
jgi:hypothetical protein